MKKGLLFKKNRRAEFTSGILVFMLLFGSLLASGLPVSAEPFPTVSAGNITLAPNSFAVVGVYANNVPSPGMAGYDLDINYDPSKIQIVGITRSAELSSPTPEFGVNDSNPSPVPNQVSVLYANFDGTGTEGDFKLFNVRVKALVALNNVSPFEISVVDFCGPDLVDITPVLQVMPIANEPNVSADNQNNLIIGLAEGMEYSINNSAFARFESGNLPNLSGNHIVFVRWSGTTTSPSGAERMLTFTEAVSIPQAEVGTTTYNSGIIPNYIAHGAAIHLKTTTLDATFYYTKGEQGNEPGNPSSADATYVDATGITIEDGKTIIKAIAVKEGMDDSNIATFTFINKVSTPYVIVSGIQYKSQGGEPASLSMPQGGTVYLGSSTSDVTFYYTMDGTIPISGVGGSTLYNATTGIANLPLGTTTLKVLGEKDPYADSGIPTFLVTVTQTISAAPVLAQISVHNNPSVTDTVTVDNLLAGDTVKVYADAATQTVLGTETLAQATGSVTVSISQLGTVAGTVYVSVTSPGKSESLRTAVPYSAEPQVINKDALTTALGNATTLITSKTVGSAVGNVPQGAKDAFQGVINAATVVKDNTSATQAAVDAQVTALGVATTAFYQAIINNTNGIETHMLGELLGNTAQFNDLLRRFYLDHLKLVIPIMYFQDVAITVNPSLASQMVVTTLSQVNTLSMTSNGTTYDGQYQGNNVFNIDFVLPLGSEVVLNAYDNAEAKLDSMTLRIKNFHYVAPTTDQSEYKLSDLVNDSTTFNTILSKFTLDKLTILAEKHIFTVGVPQASSTISVQVSNQVESVILYSGSNQYPLTSSGNGLFGGSVVGIPSGDVLIKVMDVHGNILDTRYFKL